jgi:hypothetical protein
MTTTTNTQGCTYLAPDYDARTSRVSPAPYCGHTVVEGEVYCDEHYPIVYAVGTANRKRKKDIQRAEAVWTLESLFHEVVGELEAEGYEITV